MDTFGIELEHSQKCYSSFEVALASLCVCVQPPRLDLGSRVSPVPLPHLVLLCVGNASNGWRQSEDRGELSGGLDYREV